MLSSAIAHECRCVTAAAMRSHTQLAGGSGSQPDPAAEVKGCEGSLPRRSLPWGPDTDEGDRGALYVSAFARYQRNSRVGNDYPPVFAHGRNLEQLTVKSAALHRLIEAPPMHGPKSGRDYDIETSAERIFG
jgi:hypothetical protein